jgi:hypothetical protein
VFLPLEGDGENAAAGLLVVDDQDLLGHCALLSLEKPRDITD